MSRTEALVKAAYEHRTLVQAEDMAATYIRGGKVAVITDGNHFTVHHPRGYVSDGVDYFIDNGVVYEAQE